MAEKRWLVWNGDRKHLRCGEYVVSHRYPALLTQLCLSKLSGLGPEEGIGLLEQFIEELEIMKTTLPDTVVGNAVRYTIDCTKDDLEHALINIKRVSRIG